MDNKTKLTVGGLVLTLGVLGTVVWITHSTLASILFLVVLLVGGLLITGVLGIVYNKLFPTKVLNDESTERVYAKYPHPLEVDTTLPTTKSLSDNEI